MKRVVSDDGRITIPKALRDRLRIVPGQVLDLLEEDGRLVSRKIRADDPVGDVFGILDPGRGTDELIEELRGPADLS